MKLLDWMGEHPVLTVILLWIVICGIKYIVQAY